MVALARKDDGAVEVLTTAAAPARRAVHPPSEEPDDYRRTSLAPVGPRRRTTQPPALVVDDDDEDLPEVVDEVETDAAHAAGTKDADAGGRGGRDGARTGADADHAPDGHGMPMTTRRPRSAGEDATDEACTDEERATHEDGRTEDGAPRRSTRPHGRPTAQPDADEAEVPVDEADQVTTGSTSGRLGGRQHRE